MKIKDLDIKKIKVPDGYKVIIDPELIQKEKNEKEIIEIQERIKDGEPSIEELANFARAFHPYYQDLSRLNQLES